MSIEELSKKYFVPGMHGYRLLKVYYARNHDLFSRTLHQEFEEFLNQIFLNISTINFSDNIKNIDAYIIGAIKIQCRVQLDKSIKLKNVVAESHLEKNDPEEEPLTLKIPAKESNPTELLDLQEMFLQINLFKLQLNKKDVDLLNHLIDERSRKEIADDLHLNFNTLDTHIRRLRIKMADYFKKLGYSLDTLDKFEK